jgi:hypothetical protein
LGVHFPHCASLSGHSGLISWSVGIATMIAEA